MVVFGFELAPLQHMCNSSRMKAKRSRTNRNSEGWPRKIRHGRETVTVYRRQTPTGGIAFMVANYAEGKRRFDSYADEAEAIEQAAKLARKLSERDAIGAAMSKGEALDFASACQTLAPFGVSLPDVASSMARCLKLVGALPDVEAACRFYVARHKRTVDKRVADVVAELLTVKEARGASERYMGDLRYRLNQFARDFQCNAGNVATADVQAWLDGLKLESQGYMNFRRVLHLLFGFAVARGYATDNPVQGVERVKLRSKDVKIFTPSEIARLLASSSPDFLPCLAIGAFAGLRSAEIERLEWSDVDLIARHIVVGASRAKTASRRIVPISDNLAAWLAPYAGCTGKVWTGGHDEFYERQQETALATGTKAAKPVAWKANGLRHSFASYRFAQTGDAGRVAGECGNSAAVVHRHYRELVKPAAAESWFSVSPEAPANVTALPRAATA
jgi:integrase